MESKPGDLEGLAETSTNFLESEAKSSEGQPVATPPPAAKSSETTAPPAPAAAAVADVPDPDEDDLDDLDDMLDEFNPTKTESKDAAPTSSGPGRPPVPPADAGDGEGLSDDDFAKQLQAGMADLLGELGSNTEMQAQFEAMMKDFSGPAGLASLGLQDTPNPEPSKEKSTPATSKSGPAAPSAEDSFQDTIKKTMERMQASGQSASAAAAADDSDDILAELLKQMQSGEGNEEDFSKMLLGMMEQLTNKEILYEPMKELHDKFPAWLQSNRASTPAADLKRYEEQQAIVAEIVAKFEERSYSDTNAKDREYIVDRMQKMQAAGSPPADLVGDMASAQEAFGAPEEGCPQQ